MKRYEFGHNIVLILNWMMRHWRAGCALIYTAICAFDFIIYPSYLGLGRVDMLELLQVTAEMSPEARREVIHVTYRQYVPLTLQGSGLFHLSFGAILTGAAVTGEHPFFNNNPQTVQQPIQTERVTEDAKNNN